MNETISAQDAQQLVVNYNDKFRLDNKNHIDNLLASLFNDIKLIAINGGSRLYLSQYKKSAFFNLAIEELNKLGYEAVSIDNDLGTRQYVAIEWV